MRTLVESSRTMACVVSFVGLYVVTSWSNRTTPRVSSVSPRVASSMPASWPISG